MLTDLKIKNAKPDKNKRYKLSDSNGMSVRINSKGTKTFLHLVVFLQQFQTSIKRTY